MYLGCLAKPLQCYRIHDVNAHLAIVALYTGLSIVAVLLPHVISFLLFSSISS